jgi:antitoxin PrlF
VGPGDRLEYVIERDHAIIMKRGVEQPDPVIHEFLAFLERDMLKHPDRLRELLPELVERGRSLVSDLDIDLDAPIKGDVAI